MAKISVEQFSALREWAAQNQHRAPVYKGVRGEAVIPGMADDVLVGVIAGLTVEDEINAQRMAAIRNIQQQMGDPPIGNAELMRQYARSLMTAICQFVRDEVTGYADAAKVAGWTDKAAIAERVSAGTASAPDIEILQVEATSRGLSETPDALAAIQLQRANELRMARALIDGFESQAMRLTGSAVTLPELIQTYHDQIDQAASLIEQVTSL
ncbi:MAG: hypothetical protein KZQ99_02510 [Candidatus Thiodiazotropha sp. (ex Dulcina madagascariensis)]|nr:hypothetical protein [Candidatus Thiodiazotropha sp. (ex Dulcina madagascariensis)]